MCAGCCCPTDDGAFDHRRKADIASIGVGKIRAFAVRHDPRRANLESLDNLTSADVYFGRVLDGCRTTGKSLERRRRNQARWRCNDGCEP